jgi:hypothetical protein
MKEKLNSIISEKVELQDLDYIVREYLVHSGYQESFNAMEIDNMNNYTDSNANGITNINNINVNVVKNNSIEFDIDFRK